MPLDERLALPMCLVVKLHVLSLLDLEPASACTYYCIHLYVPCRLLTIHADSPVFTTLTTRDVYSERPPHRAERYVQPATVEIGWTINMQLQQSDVWFSRRDATAPVYYRRPALPS
jgi:hypothetical protein